MARADIPKITWGAAFVNTLNFGYPLDLSMAWSEYRTHEQIRAPSGEEDAWVGGLDYFLRGNVRWIPTSTGTTPAGDAITGWDGATGWDAWIQDAGAKGLFRFFPDKDLGGFFVSSLVEVQLPPGLEGADLTRRFSWHIVNTTSAFLGY